MATRREFFKKGILAGAGFTLLNNLFGSENNPPIQPENGFILPSLPYAYDALEPFIDKQTMEIHHTKHHQAYVNNLNKSLLEVKVKSGFTLEDLCKEISKYPAAIRNNAGGHYNHSMFWKLMKPNAGSILSPTTENEATGKLGEAIKTTFDSFANFKTKFSETAMKIFGSGWAWLVINKDGKLEIGSTPNQDNPLMDLPARPGGPTGQAGVSEFKGYPIIGLDVWEHAYYLKYQNKRTDYITSWWNVVNWAEASSRFENK